MDEIVLALNLMRLEFFLEMGEYIGDVGREMQSMGDLIEKASLAGIEHRGENIEALADELEIAVQNCTNKLRVLLEYLDEHVED